MGGLSWIIQLGPKCSYTYPHKGEIWLHTEKQRETEEAVFVKIMARCDYKLRDAGSHQNLDSPLESLERMWPC